MLQHHSATALKGSAQIVSETMFLQRRIRALPLNERTVGEVLDEAIDVFENPPLDLMERFCALSDELRAIGIRLMHPLEDEDPPLHGLVWQPALLLKAYSVLAPKAESLPGLLLYRSH